MSRELIMRVFFLSFIILFPWWLLTFAKAVSSWSNMAATCFANIKWTHVTIRGEAMETLIPEPLIPAIFKPPPIKTRRKKKQSVSERLGLKLPEVRYNGRKKRKQTISEELGIDIYEYIDKKEQP